MIITACRRQRKCGERSSRWKSVSEEAMCRPNCCRRVRTFPKAPGILTNLSQIVKTKYLTKRPLPLQLWRFQTIHPDIAVAFLPSVRMVSDINLRREVDWGRFLVFLSPCKQLPWYTSGWKSGCTLKMEASGSSKAFVPDNQNYPEDRA